MKKTRKILKGLSLELDTLFFRNLTLILATILIWRGVWNYADKYFFPNDFFLSNLLTIIVGICLLFVFDSEVKEIEEEVESGKKHTHLSNEHI